VRQGRKATGFYQTARLPIEQFFIKKYCGYKLFSDFSVLDSRLRGSDTIDSGSESDNKLAKPIDRKSSPRKREVSDQKETPIQFLFCIHQ